MAENDLELLILPRPKYWDYRCVLPGLARSISSELGLWCRSVIPSSWEGEAGGSQVQDLPGQLNDYFKMKRELGYS